MKTSLVAIVLGFALALWLTPLVRRYALLLRLVDRPGEARRVHTRPVPRVGGIAIAAAVLAPLLGLAVYENLISELLYRDARRLVTLLFGALAALGIGLSDDLVGTSQRKRLLLLIGLAAFTWLGGHRIEVLGLPLVGDVALGPLGLPVTVAWIVGVVVAFNFIDGLDGLAAGVALLATATMFAMAFVERNVLWMTWTGAMAGALLGFLRYNWSPASIFMGDGGAYFLGYLMAVVALQTSRKEGTAIAILLPALALGLPLLDAALTMARRALHREGMFLSERGHLHHRLLDLGLSHRRAVLVLYAVASLLCLGALAVLTDLPPVQIGAGLAACAALAALLYATGYLRPQGLRAMYLRGLDNAARDREVAALCDDLAAELAALPSGPERVRRCLAALVARSDITGAVYRPAEGAPASFGAFGRRVAGARATIALPPASAGVAAGAVELLWEGRTSGPSRGEQGALERLLRRLVEAGEPPSDLVASPAAADEGDAAPPREPT